MLRKVLFAVLIIAMISSVWVSAISAGGQEKVTVCHKPGTEDEKTLEIAAPALAAHLGHGDTEGECGGGLPSAGCEALNTVTPDPQLDSSYYLFAVTNLEFYPGEIIHVDMTITANAGNSASIYESVGVGNPFGSVASDTLDVAAGETGAVSLDYTVVAGDGVSIAQAYAGGAPLGNTFTLDAVNFWCTAN